MEEFTEESFNKTMRRLFDPKALPDEYKIKDGNPCRCCGEERFKWNFSEYDYTDTMWKFGCDCWRFIVICEDCHQCALHCEHYDKEATKDRLAQKEKEAGLLTSEAWLLCEELGLDMDKMECESDLYTLERTLKLQLHALERFIRRNTTAQGIDMTLSELKQVWGERDDAGGTFSDD